jgi:N-carbamoylputrescine amidase
MSPSNSRKRKVRIALIQGREQGSPAADLSYTIERIREAAAAGAQIVCTQELFNTPYFCRTQETRLFDLAEPIPGATTEALATVAGELGVVIIAALFERRSPGVYHNTAAVIDADGSYLGKYRKMHIPQDPGFEEKFYFTPGDLGYKVWDTKFGKVSVLICWDQWFPEAARLAALAGAEIIFYPTAIGWLPEEKAELGAAQHTAWETVQRGHAVANGCYVAAVNRTGIEGETEFWGQSFVADFYGQIVARAPVEDEHILIADCDLKALEDTRRIWPFFRDRRIDTYQGITQRMLDED